jgi:hypothetical protein
MVEIEAPNYPPGFHKLLGQFHGIWLSLDPVLDYSIGFFLSIPPEDTHVIVAGMEFGKKLRILIDLIRRYPHPRKAELIKQLKILQGSKRDQITHAYIASNREQVIFISRSRGGEYNATKLSFSIKEFSEHVVKILHAAQAYDRALGAKPDDVIAFANAALRTKNS